MHRHIPSSPILSLSFPPLSLLNFMFPFPLFLSPLPSSSESLSLYLVSVCVYLSLSLSVHVSLSVCLSVPLFSFSPFTHCVHLVLPCMRTGSLLGPVDLKSTNSLSPAAIPCYRLLSSRDFISPRRWGISWCDHVLAFSAAIMCATEQQCQTNAAWLWCLLQAFINSFWMHPLQRWSMSIKGRDVTQMAHPDLSTLTVCTLTDFHFIFEQGLSLGARWSGLAGWLTSSRHLPSTPTPEPQV